MKRLGSWLFFSHAVGIYLCTKNFSLGCHSWIYGLANEPCPWETWYSFKSLAPCYNCYIIMFWIQGRMYWFREVLSQLLTGTMSTCRAIVNFHGNMLHTLYQGQFYDSKNKKSAYDNIATYTQSQFRNLKAKSMHIIHHAVIRWFLPWTYTDSLWSALALNNTMRVLN